MKKTKNKQHSIAMAKRKAAKKLKYKQAQKSGVKPILPNNKMKALLDNMVDVSMRYLQEGVNYYFTNNGGLEKGAEFLDTLGKGTNFSVGVRGCLNRGSLEVSPPLTWIPRANLPVVKDYLTELWNRQLEGVALQVNSFSFFLVDDEEEEGEDLGEDVDISDFIKNMMGANADVEAQVETQVEAQVEAQVETEVEAQVEAQAEAQVEAQVETQVEAQVETQVEAQVEAEAEVDTAQTEAEITKMFEDLMKETFGENFADQLAEINDQKSPFLVACVIMAGESLSRLNGYLVLRKAEYVEGEGVSLKGENIYLSLEEVLDIHVAPMGMPEVLKAYEETQNDESNTENEVLPVEDTTEPSEVLDPSQNLGESERADG